MTQFPRLRVLGLAALAVAVLAMAANAAQPPREGQRGGFRGRPGGRGPGMGMRGGPGGGGVANLLRNSQVQEELKLSDEQKDQLEEIGEKVREGMQGIFPDREAMQDLSDEERRAKMQEAMEKFAKEREKRAPEIEKQIAEVLEKGQFKRLKQIELQVQGVNALRRPDIAQALELSEDQQKEIKEALEARDKKMQGLEEERRGMFSGGFGGFQDMSEEERGELRQKMEKLGEKRRAITSEAQKEAMGKLTDEQKAKMPDLMGERLEFRRPEGGPGRPGQGRRDGERRDGERREGERGRRPRPDST
ncbi:MAG: Spy/CpxP family protein refolding chaperone [Planctomycetes bacterium]|nr:Spy/CpxP family protein refolding chaperone [Planctomycetota bacterium]